jgi:hypothetical protein
VFPQVVRSLALHAGSGSPAGTKAQWPINPVWLHDTQAPLHATLQQTPSAQKPEEQSSAVWQTAPLALLPHLLATHCCEAAHSTLVVQVAVQRLVLGSQL